MENLREGQRLRGTTGISAHAEEQIVKKGIVHHEKPVIE